VGPLRGPGIRIAAACAGVNDEMEPLSPCGPELAGPQRILQTHELVTAVAPAPLGRDFFGRIFDSWPGGRRVSSKTKVELQVIEPWDARVDAHSARRWERQGDCRPPAGPPVSTSIFPPEVGQALPNAEKTEGPILRASSLQRLGIEAFAGGPSLVVSNDRAITVLILLDIGPTQTRDLGEHKTLIGHTRRGLEGEVVPRSTHFPRISIIPSVKCCHFCND
jgi:hypothetical protein